jgi:phosphoglycolate phosphatase
MLASPPLMALEPTSVAPKLLEQFKSAPLIGFDNDGTLYPAGLDVARIVLIAHRDFVEENGLDILTPDLSWVKHQLGADAKEFYGSMLPGQPESIRGAFEEFCLDYEQQAVQEFGDLYPGADELLADLHAAGKTLVLISNGSPRYVETVWTTCGYGRFMQAMYPYGPPDFSSKGERLVNAIAQFGGPAVFIGDRESDRHAAEHAGVPLIGCAYGYGEPGELDGAAAIVESIEELRALLL